MITPIKAINKKFPILVISIFVNLPIRANIKNNNDVTKNTNTATAITESPETANATKLAIKVPIAPKVKHFKYLQKHLLQEYMGYIC